ncbi:MAG: nitroreductase/quinone reductase family protein [Thermoleophilaceae bacterium]
MAGTTTLLLTTTGRKSGERRTTPLIYQEHDGDYLIVASNGGADEPPAWYLNLQEDPSVTVQVKAEVFKSRPRGADAAEKPEMWKTMTGGLAGLRRVPAEDRPGDSGRGAGTRGCRGVAGHPCPPTKRLRGARVRALRLLQALCLALGRDLHHVPGQADGAQRADDQAGEVDLPPLQALDRGAGKAWWLWCQASPSEGRASQKTLVDLSSVSNRR